MDSINAAFSPACPFLPFVPKELMERKVCPMDYINTAFSPACPSHNF